MDMVTILLILIGATVAILLLFVIVIFMRMDAVMRAKFKRMLTHKPYGVAYFHLGQQIFPRVINFENDIIRTKKALWTIQQSAVYVQKAIDEGKFSEDKTKLETDELIEHIQGVPVIHFDYNVLAPLRYGKYDASKIPNPQQIQATIKKELEYLEAELMYHHRDKLKKLLIICLIMSFIAVGIGIFDTLKIMDIAQAVIPAA